MFFSDRAYAELEAKVKQSAIGGDEDAMDDLGVLKKAVQIFAEYVYAVSEERIELRFAQGVVKGDEYREIVTHYDGTRHTAHEQAIVYTRMLNRIAKAYGVQPVFLGDENNRREIGSFCGEFSSWLFENRYS